MPPHPLGFDSRLFLLINNGLENRLLDPIMIIATLLGEPLYLAIFLLPALWLIDRAHFKRNFFLFVFVTVAAVFASEAVKHLVNSPRPLKGMKDLIDAGEVHIHVLLEPRRERGFPSGHAARIFSVAVLFLFFYRKTGWMLIGIGTLTMLSRIYVGAHYPSDALGGAIIGSLVAVIVHRVYASLTARRASPPPNASELPH